MSGKPKTIKRKHSNKTVLVIFILHSAGKLYKKIVNYVKILKSIVIRILQ